MDSVWLTEMLANLKAQAAGLSPMEVLRSPYFLAFSALFCGLALLKRALNALVLYLVAIGLVLLYNYAVPARCSADIQGQSLLTFAGGALVVAALAVYFFFIRSD